MLSFFLYQCFVFLKLTSVRYKYAHLQKLGLALNFSVLIIGYFLINHNSFSPFVPTKGAKALHLVQLFVVAVAAVTASC